MKRIVLVLMLLHAMIVVKAQVVQVPVTPAAQEFLKYGEVPVSEYTGIPNISIPIYSIVEDDVEVPIKLTYHAGGIRVTDEASWVGLGWNLQFGSVVQIVMGHDDFIDDPMFSKKLPDYHGSPIPTDFPHRYRWPFEIDGLAWPGPTLPVYEPTDNHSFKIVTDYWVPINGNNNQQHQDLFDGNYVDSQPDIIKINFLDHSLNIVRSKTGKLTVLNEKGYIVKRINTSSDNWGWEVTTPDGNTFSFEMKSEADIDHNYSSKPQSENVSGPLSYKPQKQWYLTKIKTTKNKTITFKYDIVSKVTNFPSYSQKYINYEEGTTTRKYDCSGKHFALLKNKLTTGLVDYVFRTSQELPYLTEIEFTNGKAKFNSSTRDDILGARKLNGIVISNNKGIFKQFSLEYDYFTASNGIALNNAGGLTGLDENKEKKRLKLLSIKEAGKEPYEFKYNATELPYKNTFAVDYWGFYNGNHNNSSLIPNPSRFDNCDLDVNSNNHSANLNFAKAGILEKIVYPTKGTTEFDYELNEFNNYWVPSYTSTSNNISEGYGLRIRAIINKDQNGDFVGKAIYSYSGGKSIVPRNFFNTYGIQCYIASSKTSIPYYTTEIFSSNSYSSNLFGSINGVGYDEVRISKTAIDESQTNGQRTLTFSNYPDRSYQMNHQLMSLPVITDRSKYTNGSLLSELTCLRKGGTNIPIRKVIYDYKIDKSSIFYGAQIMPYPMYIYRYIKAGTEVCILGLKARHLIGYYPLYSDKTLLKTKEIYDYYPFHGLNSSVYSKTTFTHTPYNLLEAKTTYDKFNNELIKEIFNYPDYSSTLMVKNMLNTVVRKYTYKRNKFYTLERYNYVDKDELTLLNEHLTYFEGFNYKTPRSIIYKEHDNVGNVTKYETSKGDINYILWGYNKTYPVAKIVSNNDAISIIDLQEAIDILSLSESDSKNSVDGDITKIKNVISSSSQLNTSDMITLFTYKPLFGVTSQTDPNGISTYYEYDSYGRLEYIKDSDGHILKHHVYHYQNQ